MSLIFCGDCALPFGTEVDVSPIAHIFKGNVGIANLEGAILTDPAECDLYRYADKFSLYSSPSVVPLLHSLNIGYVTLLNNHALDYKPDIQRTVRMLASDGIMALGPDNPDTLSFEYNGREVMLMSFALGGCLHNYPLVSIPHIINRVTELRAQHPDALICLFPHWGLEMDALPEPSDRILAHKLIDAGADLIVGHHSHITQPVEVYKGKHIVYSLGNFILPQVDYGHRKLFFRDDRVLKMCVAEFDGTTFTLHHLKFDKATNTMLMDDEPPSQQYIESSTTDSDYRRQYIAARGRLHYLRNARWGNGAISERTRHMRMDAVHRLRGLMIRMHLHNPFD